MPSRARYLSLILLALVGAAILAVVISSSKSERVFTVSGIIRAPYSDGTIKIQHAEIPGYMPAMTMPFYADEADVRNLVPGDKVEFEFRVGEESRATKFRKMGRVDVGQEAPPPTLASPPRRLRPGDVVPSFTLLDQDGRILTEANLRAHPTIVTFIFTRCPVPEFCPLIGKKFQSLQNELAKSNARARLLSISIDPEYDQPAVLRTYGQSLGANFERWRFATGSPQQVETLTRLFAVRAERNAGSLDHTLATALIAPDGKVVEIWRGNAWKPEEILEKLEARPR